MNNIGKLFDYFKKAFHINKQNKGLYMPQMVFIVLKAIMFVGVGVFLFNFVTNIDEMAYMDKALIQTFVGFAWWMVALVLVGVFGSMIVEAGLFNMYKMTLIGENVNSTVFYEGVRKYIVKILLANLLTFAFWILFLIPYVIIGVLTLLSGFIVIPLLITVFTTMWKVSIVIEELGVIQGLKQSIRFAKANFKPLTVLVIIQQAFIASGYKGSGGSGSSGNTGTGNLGNLENMPDVMHGSSSTVYNTEIEFHQMYQEALPFIKTGMYILIPVINIAIVVSSLVKMVFEIFFQLTIFIMYVENRDNIEVDENKNKIESNIEPDAIQEVE